MRTSVHSPSVHGPCVTLAIALGLALLLFTNHGGCSPADPNAGSGDTPGSVVLGLLIDNPAGQDPNDPSVPSTQIELPSGAILDVRPSALDFGSDYSQISFTVQNVGKGTVNYSVLPATPWATVSATEGDSSGERDGFTVFVNRSGLEPAAYSGAVDVTAEGVTVSVALNLTVGDAVTSGALEVAPAELDFGASATQIPLTVRATRRAETAYTITSSVPWLDVQPASGTSAGELDALTATLRREDLAPGDQSGTITVADAGGGTAVVNVRATGAATHTISGYIRNGQSGVGGVTVAANNGGGSGVTDSSGRYQLDVPHAWYGSVSPRGAAFAYMPSNRIVTNTRRGVESVDFEATAPAIIAPGFGIRYADGDGRVYRGGRLSVSDDRMSASLRLVDEQQWELTVHNGSMGIIEVWFPWDVDHVTLNDDLDDDVIFTPLFAGVAKKPHVVGDFDWSGYIYPCSAFAPLNVLADPHRARIVAATIWPPRSVMPMYSLHRMSLLFKQPLAPWESRSYTAVIGMFEGDASQGLPPWMIAADRYASWLKARMQESGEYPNPAAWFRNSEGWLHIGLNGGVWFDPDYLYRLYDRYSQYFPHAQFWGQMSNYDGDDHEPVPPLNPGETTGCCLTRRDFHPRYLPELIEFAQYVRARGGGVSYYTRPRDDEFGVELMLDDPTVINGETNLQWYREWIARHLTANHANAIYLDVMGRRNLGEASVIRQAVAGVPHESVCEGIVDFYPFGSLLSGFVSGNSAGGLPSRTLEGLGQGYDQVSTPRFGRYLLADRYSFLGQSNHDEEFWGPQANHVVERQVFLLGCKFDCRNPYNDPDTFDVMQPVMEMIINERQRVNWWPRNPQYRDRLGITDLPSDVDVRHFMTNDGKSLLVVENWSQSLGRWFRFYGNTIGVPMTKFSIIETQPFTN